MDVDKVRAELKALRELVEAEDWEYEAGIRTLLEPGRKYISKVTGKEKRVPGGYGGPQPSDRKLGITSVGPKRPAGYKAPIYPEPAEIGVKPPRSGYRQPKGKKVTRRGHTYTEYPAQTPANTGVSYEHGLSNLTAVYQRAKKIFTADELEYWLKWYDAVSRFVGLMARKYNQPKKIVAAMVAALSPGLDPRQNMAETEKILSGSPTKPFRPANTEKAKKIMSTGNVDLVHKAGAQSDEKVAVFYRNLANPVLSRNDAVIDGHMICLWRGIKVPISSVRTTKKERQDIIKGLRELGSKVGAGAQQMQALLWTTWRMVVAPANGRYTIKVKEVEELPPAPDESDWGKVSSGQVRVEKSRLATDIPYWQKENRLQELSAVLKEAHKARRLRPKDPDTTKDEPRAQFKPEDDPDTPKKKKKTWAKRRGPVGDHPSRDYKREAFIPENPLRSKRALSRISPGTLPPKEDRMKSLRAWRKKKMRKVVMGGPAQTTKPAEMPDSTPGKAKSQAEATTYVDDAPPKDFYSTNKKRKRLQGDQQAPKKNRQNRPSLRI